jgi:hypothetical protein
MGGVRATTTPPKSAASDSTKAENTERNSSEQNKNTEK